MESLCVGESTTVTLSQLLADWHVPADVDLRFVRFALQRERQ